VHGNELSGARGIITSPLYPLSYRTTESSEEVITWRITVDDGMAVQFGFNVFEIHRSCFADNCQCRSKIQVGLTVSSRVAGLLKQTLLN
jgi:hypothetical protein